MEALTKLVGDLNSIVWGVPMLILILGVGLYLTFGLRLLTIIKIPFGFDLLWKGRIPGDDKGISPFNALMTSLAATIGTGNIAGVATAIFLGGPGAVFWMWMTALVGMATKYAEAVLAVRFRETDERGKQVGGPMYYIQNGLGANWKWLAMCFALFAGIAGCRHRKYGAGQFHRQCVKRQFLHPRMGHRRGAGAFGRGRPFGRY